MKFGKDYLSQTDSISIRDLINANSVNSIGEQKEYIETPADKAKQILKSQQTSTPEATSSGVSSAKPQYSLDELVSGKSFEEQDEENKPSAVGTVLKNIQVGLGKGIDASVHPIDSAQVGMDTLLYEKNVGATKDRIDAYNTAMRVMQQTGAKTYQGKTVAEWKNSLNLNNNNRQRAEYWYEKGAEDTKDLASKTILTEKQQEKIAQVEEDTAKLGETGQFFAGLAQSAGAMGPSIAAGIVTGGLGTALGASAATAEVLGSAAGLTTMFNEVYTRDVKDLSTQGYDWTDASEKAFLDACVEVGTEVFVGGTPGMRAGLFDNAIAEPVSKAVTSMTSKFGEKLITKAGEEAAGAFISSASAGIGNMLVNGSFGEFFSNCLGEGVEEMASALLEPYVDRATINPDADNASASEVLLSGLGGALMGVFFNLSELSFQKATSENKAVVKDEATGKYKTVPAEELTQEMLALPESDLKYLNGPQVEVGENGVMYGTGPIAEVEEEIGGGKNAKVDKTKPAKLVKIQGLDGKTVSGYQIGKDYYLDKEGTQRAADGSTIYKKGDTKKVTYRWSEETATKKTKRTKKTTETVVETPEVVETTETVVETPEVVETTETVAETPEVAETATTESVETKPVETTPITEQVGYIDVNQPDAVYRNNVLRSVIMVNELLSSGIFDNTLYSALGLNQEDFGSNESYGFSTSFIPSKKLVYTNTLSLDDVKNYLNDFVIPAINERNYEFNNAQRSAWDEKFSGNTELLRVQIERDGHTIEIPMTKDEYIAHKSELGKSTERTGEEFDSLYKEQLRKVKDLVNKFNVTANKFGIKILVSTETEGAGGAFTPVLGTGGEIIINPNLATNEHAVSYIIAHELIHAIQSHESKVINNPLYPEVYKKTDEGPRVQSLRELRSAYQSAFEQLGIDVSKWEELIKSLYKDEIESDAKRVKSGNKKAFKQASYESEFDAYILSSIMQSPEVIFDVMQTDAGRGDLCPALKGFVEGLITQETEPEVKAAEEEIVENFEAAEAVDEKLNNPTPEVVEEVAEVVDAPVETIEEVFAEKDKPVKKSNKKSGSKKIEKDTAETKTSETETLKKKEYTSEERAKLERKEKKENAIAKRIFQKGAVGTLRHYQAAGSEQLQVAFSEINDRKEIWAIPNGLRNTSREIKDLKILGFEYDERYKVYKLKFDADVWTGLTGEKATSEQLMRANQTYLDDIESGSVEKATKFKGPETSKEKILVKYKGEKGYIDYGSASYKSFIDEVKEDLKEGKEIDFDSIVDEATGDELFNSANPKNYVRPSKYYDVKKKTPYLYTSDGTRVKVETKTNSKIRWEEYLSNYVRKQQAEEESAKGWNPKGASEVKTYKLTPEELAERKLYWARTARSMEAIIDNPELLDADDTTELNDILDSYPELEVLTPRKAFIKENASIDDQWQMAGKKYGVQDEETGTPKQPDSQRVNSKTAGHAMKADDMTAQMKQHLQQSILEGNQAYVTLKNSEVEKKARSWMNRKEFQNDNGNFNLNKAYKDFMPRAKAGLSSAEEIAQGLLLWGRFRQLANQRLSEGKELTVGEMDAWDKLMSVMAVNAQRLGSAVQFFRNMNSMTGDGRVYYMNLQLDAIKQELQQKTNIFERKAKDALEDYTIPDDYLNELRNATTEEDVLKAEEKIKNDIASKIPPTIGSRVTAWRYLSMLGNVRTHERNIISNAAMWLARNVRDLGDAAAEDIFLSKSENARNATMKKASKEIKALAKQQWELHKDEIQTGGKLGFTADIMQRAAQFGNTKAGQTVETVSRKNSDLLEMEDSWFLQATFRQVFAQYVAANESRWLANAPAGMTIDQYLATATNNADAAEMLNEALSKATTEAKRATYREASDLASWLNHQSNKGGWQKLIIEGIMPYKRTPINILKQGVRYSPIGIINGATQLVKVASGQEVIDKATGNAKTVADCITDMCAGMTGTMIMGLGIFLGGAGIMKAGGSDSDREEYYDEMTGNQKYSVTIGDYNITLDWLTPLSMPLFAGVTLADAMFNEDVEDDEDTNKFANFNNVLGALTSMADPFTNLSLLSGVNDALNSYSDDKLGEAITSAASSYASQFIPTLAGQIARSMDDVRRTTYAEKDVDMVGGQKMAKFINKLKAKIPFLAETNEEYVDMWGRTEESGGFISQALVPWYAKKSNSTEVDDKLAEVFEATKDNSVLPATPQSYYTISEKKYYLDPEDYTDVKKTVGQLSYNGVDEVFKSNLYDQLSTDQQADAITAVYTYAKEVAKYEYTSASGIAYDKKSTITKVDDAQKVGLSVGDYFVIKQLLSDDAAGSKNSEKKAVGRALGLTTAQIKVFLRD